MMCSPRRFICRIFTHFLYRSMQFMRLVYSIGIPRAQVLLCGWCCPQRNAFCSLLPVLCPLSHEPPSPLWLRLILCLSPPLGCGVIL